MQMMKYSQMTKFQAHSAYSSAGDPMNVGLRDYQVSDA